MEKEKKRERGGEEYMELKLNGPSIQIQKLRTTENKMGN
jgi:uncharacterized protein (DUF736 family)